MSSYLTKSCTRNRNNYPLQSHADRNHMWHCLGTLHVRYRLKTHGVENRRRFYVGYLPDMNSSCHLPDVVFSIKGTSDADIGVSKSSAYRSATLDRRPTSTMFVRRVNWSPRGPKTPEKPGMSKPSSASLSSSGRNTSP